MRHPIVARCLCGRGKFTDDGRPCSACRGAGSADRAWTTMDELAFIRMRADQGRVVCGEFITSSQFLRNYLSGARLRTDWADLDRESIMGTAQALLDAKERAA